MSTIIFNTENSVSKSWADVAEGLNYEYRGPAEEWGNTADYLGGLTDHDQQISSFVKISNKIALYKSPEKTLAICVAAPTPGQTLGIKHLDLELIKKQLDSGIKVVYFGYAFTEESVSQTDVVERSSYYGRNLLNNRLTDLVTNEERTENFSAALWMAWYKFKDADIYYCILNDNLLDSTLIRTETSDVSFADQEDTYILLNTQDGNFKEAVFAPGLNGAKFVGDIIVTENAKFEIDVFQQSQLHKNNGARLPDDALPTKNIKVESSMGATIENNRITVDLGEKTTGFVSYKWWTGTDLDFTKNEELKYSFVVVKV